MTPENPYAISITNLSHNYKNHAALKNVSFNVSRRSIHGFVGPNGAGKTTTLKIVATLVKPSKGQVTVLGHDFNKDLGKIRSKIGFMPDHFSMYRQMSVYEYLDFFGAAYGLVAKTRADVIRDVLVLTDMEGRKNDLIKGLSRGMEQRVSLARVLVHDPEVLILDEPASGLDPRARIELMEILSELRSLGKTIFISSHILSELATLCDGVTILDRGEVRYSGDMRGLLTHDTVLKAYRLELEEPCPPLALAFKQDSSFSHVEVSEDGLIYRLQYDPSAVGTSRILEKVLESAAKVKELREDLKHLNQAFMDLTQPGARA